MAELIFEGLPFDEAASFFRQKVRMPTRTWTDLWQGMHARAFVVAGAMKDELLADFQTAIAKGLEEGTTLAEFRRDFDRIVATHGWQYKGGRGWRSRVIFNTNMRTAYQAGRWNQIQRLKARRPYLRYSAILDSRTRAEHRGWHGTILDADNEWWSTYYPPNGWNCRCTVQQLSQRDLDRLGVTPSPAGPIMPPVKKKAGGAIVEVPQGIDPGWAYNVGEAAWGRQLSEQAMDAWRAQGGSAFRLLNPGDWRSAGRPAAVPFEKAAVRLGPVRQTAEEVAGDLRRLLGGAEKTFILPDGGAVLLNADALAGHLAPNRAPFLPLLTATLEDPFEIWATFERHEGTGQVVLRKRAIRAFDTGEKRSIVVVAQAAEGRFEVWTMVPRRKGGIQKQRIGWLLYGR